MKQSTGHDVRFIVLNADERFGAELRALLSKVARAKIVAEVEEPALLGQAAKQFPVDVVVANLDPSPEAVIPIVAQVVAASPDLSFFAASESTDGQLILRAIRAGFKEFLPKPIEEKALAEAVDKVAARRTGPTELGTLITVMGASGGVGATMFATNLATELALAGSDRVIIVDLDYRFGQVATLLDVDPTYTLADLCNTPEQLEPQLIERALVKHDSGVYVMSRPQTFAQADSITAASCVGLLSSLLQFNEYVVIDGPTRFDRSAKSVLDISDVNFLVVQLLVPTVRNASRILTELREGGYGYERTKLICNRIGRESCSLTTEDATETLGLSAFASIPDDWPTVSSAINLGETLESHSPKSSVRQVIEEIARRLHSPDSHSDDNGTQKKGLLGRIFANT